MEFDVFKDFRQMALLTAGTPDDFNTMTVSWGAQGVIWRKDACTVYVRMSRYTLEFMDKYDYFTLSFFDGHQKDLTYLGTHSGRDEDKVAKTTLTPVAAPHDAVAFKEARKTLVCKKMYKQLMDLSAMPEDVQKKLYGGADEGDVHYMFIGEIVETL